MTIDEEDDIVKNNKLSRRTFLKGAAAGGAIAAVAVAGVAELTVLSTQPNNSTTTTSQSGSTTSQSGSTTSTTVTPTSVSTVSLTVNGLDYAVRVDNRWSLSEALRTKLNLIGTKIGCDRGECGACAVLVDGVPMLSCMMLAVQAQGKQITTIEGIGTPEKLSKIQASLIDNDGVQCGICMAGIVVVSTAFLKQNPAPTDLQWRTALAGNLCKCANWPFILQGLEAVK